MRTLLRLSPPSPYNALNLSDALVTSLHDLWLRTGLVELVEHTNKQLKVKTIQKRTPLKYSQQAPPWCVGGGACAPLAFSCLLGEV